LHKEHDCGCAPACTSCTTCGSAAPLPPAKVGDPMKPADGPMKLPTGDKPTDKPTDKPKEISTPKNLELTPTGGSDKIIESGTKNPF
jgi:hypothetical protein